MMSEYSSLIGLPTVTVGEIQRWRYNISPCSTSGGCLLLPTGLLPRSVFEAASTKMAQLLPSVLHLVYSVARKRNPVPILDEAEGLQ